MTVCGLTAKIQRYFFMYVCEETNQTSIMKITCVLTFLLAAALPATSGFVSIAPISGAAASRVVGAKSSSSAVVGNNNNYAPSSTRTIRSLAMATDDNDSVTNRIVFGHSLYGPSPCCCCSEEGAERNGSIPGQEARRVRPLPY